MIVYFLFYVDLISVAATVSENTWYRFVFATENLRLGPRKIKFFTLENSWNFVIISLGAPYYLQPLF